MTGYSDDGYPVDAHVSNAQAQYRTVVKQPRNSCDPALTEEKSIGKKVLIHILLIILGESLRPSTTLVIPFLRLGSDDYSHTHETDEPYQISIQFYSTNHTPRQWI